jgi:hypothetical protein
MFGANLLLPGALGPLWVVRSRGWAPSSPAPVTDLTRHDSLIDNPLSLFCAQTLKMSEVISAISLESQLGSPNSTEDLLPHSDCSNNGTCSDTASQKSDDKSSVSGDHLEDTSSVPTPMDLKHEIESEGPSTSDNEDSSSGMYYVQVKGLPRFYRLGVHFIFAAKKFFLILKF